MLDGLKLDPVAFTLPIGEGFPVYWYGIIITLGIALGSLWGAREIRRRGQSEDEFFNGLLIAVLSGYLFARLTYVLLDVLNGRGSAYTSFIDVINIRLGGANILGGFVGAALVTWLYLAWRKQNFWDYADVVGPTLLLAQSIGRWGNFINQELYGPPTTLPWGILIEPAYRLPEYASLSAETRFHPTFFYESLWLLLGFILLTNLNKRLRDEWRAGTLFALFLMWWGFGRFFLEFLRPDQANIGNTPLTYSMLIALGIALTGVLLYLQRGRGASLINLSKKRRIVKPKPRRDVQDA